MDLTEVAGRDVRVACTGSIDFVGSRHEETSAKRRFFAASFSATAGICLVVGALASGQAFAAEGPEVLMQYGVSCHSAKKASGAIRLDGLADKSKLLASRGVLENAWKRLLNREISGI
jgi:hypothetical protein